MRYLMIVAALLVAVTMTTTTAQAAPSEQRGCAPGVVRQDDMAGTYESSTMHVEIYPCGGSYVQWTNIYGLHYAVYVAADRHVTGGIYAYPTGTGSHAGASLDSATVIGYKPAERGYIQVLTANDAGVIGVYRLRKIL